MLPLDLRLLVPARLMLPIFFRRTRCRFFSFLICINFHKMFFSTVYTFSSMHLLECRKVQSSFGVCRAHIVTVIVPHYYTRIQPCWKGSDWRHCPTTYLDIITGIACRLCPMRAKPAGQSSTVWTQLNLT